MERCHKSNKVWPGKQDDSQVRRLRVKRAATSAAPLTPFADQPQLHLWSPWPDSRSRGQLTLAWQLWYRTDVPFIAPAVRLLVKSSSYFSSPSFILNCLFPFPFSGDPFYIIIQFFKNYFVCYFFKFK